MRKTELIEQVAKAIYEAVYKNRFEDAAENAKKEARIDARTIISADLCRQSTIDAAKRLNTWHWLDRKQPHTPWEEAPEALRSILLKKAAAGMGAVRVRGRESAA